MAKRKKKTPKQTPPRPVKRVHIFGYGGGDAIIRCLFKACGYQVVTHYPACKPNRKTKKK